jgi:hypothetical protein
LISWLICLLIHLMNPKRRENAGTAGWNCQYIYFTRHHCWVQHKFLFPFYQTEVENNISSLNYNFISLSVPSLSFLTELSCSLFKSTLTAVFYDLTSCQIISRGLLCVLTKSWSVDTSHSTIFIKNALNIILPSTSTSFEWRLPFSLSNQNKQILKCCTLFSGVRFFRTVCFD